MNIGYIYNSNIGHSKNQPTFSAKVNLDAISKKYYCECDDFKRAVDVLNDRCKLNTVKINTEEDFFSGKSGKVYLMFDKGEQHDSTVKFQIGNIQLNPWSNKPYFISEISQKSGFRDFAEYVNSLITHYSK